MNSYELITIFGGLEVPLNNWTEKNDPSALMFLFMFHLNLVFLWRHCIWQFLTFALISFIKNDNFLLCNQFDSNTSIACFFLFFHQMHLTWIRFFFLTGKKESFIILCIYISSTAVEFQLTFNINRFDIETPSFFLFIDHLFIALFLCYLAYINPNIHCWVPFNSINLFWYLFFLFFFCSRFKPQWTL